MKVRLLSLNRPARRIPGRNRYGPDCLFLTSSDNQGASGRLKEKAVNLKAGVAIAVTGFFLAASPVWAQAPGGSGTGRQLGRRGGLAWWGRANTGRSNLALYARIEHPRVSQHHEP